MKKFLMAIVLALSFTFSSCAINEGYDGIYVGTEYRTRSYVDFATVVRYGSAVYTNGVLTYYTYNGLFYYPIFYDNYWYVRVYHRPQHVPPIVPHKYDYRFKPGHYPGFNRPKVTPPPQTPPRARRATPKQPDRMSPTPQTPVRPNRSIGGGRTPRSSSQRK